MLLPPPLRTRRGIPFYHDKTEAEFSADAYERYAGLVARQTALHLRGRAQTDVPYPFQPVLDYVLNWLPVGLSTLADIGCSTGRLIAELALRNPAADCYGIDYSYQMLRQAQDYWCLGQSLRPHLASVGLETPELAATQLPGNLQFALARAEALPFPDCSLDGLLTTFLLDRLDRPVASLREFYRVLRPGGRLCLVTPLNFLTTEGWSAFHPPVKLYHALQRAGWNVLDWTDPLLVREPIDGRGNTMEWNCVAVTAMR